MAKLSLFAHQDALWGGAQGSGLKSQSWGVTRSAHEPTFPRDTSLGLEPTPSPPRIPHRTQSCGRPTTALDGPTVGKGDSRFSFLPRHPLSAAAARRGP